MKKLLFTLFLILLFTNFSFSQVAIDNMGAAPNSKAVIDIDDTGNAKSYPDNFVGWLFHKLNNLIII